MKRFISNKKTLIVLGIIFIFLIWFLISLIFDEYSIIFPSPIKTIKRSIEILSTSYVYECLLASFIKMIIGFVIAFILALIFGIISGNNKSFKIFLNPLITTLKSIPTAALVFLFLVITGATNTPIMMVILISFPILYESVVAGFSNIDKEIIDTIRIDTNNSFLSTFYVKLPMSLSYIIVGIASSFALSFKIEIMSEIITGSTRSGLGSAIMTYQRNDPTDMTSILAFSFIAIIFILIVSFICKFAVKKISFVK